VEEFAIAVVPTEDERKVKHLVIDIVRGCVKKAFLSSSRRVEVEAFGSFVNNLSTWNSDVDLVVTGVMEPDRYTGGFGRVERRVVAGHLERIAAQLRRHKKLDLAKLHIIKSAKIPIIKLRTKQHVTVDISLGDDSGPRAANYIVQQQRLFPPLRPLVVVLKCYLRSCGLNEVATGGLSSYSLTNMVIAHLQVRGPCVDGCCSHLVGASCPAAACWQVLAARCNTFSLATGRC
jgi:non-canonical poly(A) RNA polymerase PAPD5/7